jgi:regulatory protein
MKQFTEQEALHRCAVFCSTAERCIQDVDKKLERWEIPFSIRKNILIKLQQEGFLDESRYCRSFVNDKFKFSKWGKNKIYYALKQKQISEENILEAIQQIDAKENMDMLMQLIRQKRKSVKGKDDYEIRMKLMRFALGRGFGVDEINRCL